jgi:GNAT superfamily N-acetyltransferase
VHPLIIEPSSQAEAELNSFLDARIYEFNIQATGFKDGRPFAGVVRDEAGQVIAAINGHTWGGCCHVVHLWVRGSRRRQGYGSALLRSAEEEAITRGCAQVLLLTHSFQAPAFYEHLGYMREATIPNYPHGHAQHVYIKRFGGESGA